MSYIYIPDPLVLVLFIVFLFFIFWKKLYKSKYWLWGIVAGLFLMITPRLIQFLQSSLRSLPGILLLGMALHLFFLGLKEKENRIKKIGLRVSGLLLILISLCWLLGGYAYQLFLWLLFASGAGTF